MKFALGQVVETREIAERIKSDHNFRTFVMNSFTRHCNGDWGDLCEEDKSLNDSGLANGDDMLFSKYNYDEDTSIYIITEWDRSATTILFPEEY